MKNQTNQHLQTVLLAAITTIFLLGAFNLTFAQNGIGKKYGSRDPSTCADSKLPKNGAPSAAQAAQYVICSSEHEINDLYLVENVTVQVGKGRAYNIREDINFPDIDTKFPVYPIRGSLTKYNCDVIYLDRSNLNRNCSVYNQPNAKGACYKDSFGDWHCAMTDASGQLTAENQPPPGASAIAPKDTKNVPKKQPNVEKQTENKDENGYTKPDFSALEKWYQITRYEYKPIEKKLYIYFKTDVAYRERPSVFKMEFRNKDGMLMLDTTLSWISELSNAEIGELTKGYVNMPRESAMKDVVSVKAVRIIE